MLRGDSRQLLILGIPTISLVFGLLLLRHRRRKRGTLHTDPGGITDSPLNQELSEDEIELNFEQTCKLLPISGEKKLPGEPELPNEKIPCDKVESSGVEVALEAVKSSISKLDCALVKEEISKTEISAVNAKSENIVDTIDLTEETIDSIDLTEEVSSSEESFATDREEGELTRSTISDDSQIIEELSKTSQVSLCEGNPTPAGGNALVSENSFEEGELLDSSVEEVVETIKPSAAAEVETVKLETAEMKKGEQGELVDKLVNLELDSMNITNSERKGGSSERDSANHSPSEVMLASPSISNFSDAHSEGSSDSGKGHSDVATSPSRTPAGGSSLAGDVALSVYEFVLPQGIVGRLIGRHGASLHEIRSSTGTNIFIKRHPETNKLKICAIEGTQQDIEKALAKIRQKFPVRRFPQLTLEKVSFVSLNNNPPLKLEDFHLQLVEGVNNDVILSSLISAAHFFLQQPSHPSYVSLTALNTVMNTVYNSPEAPVLDPPVKDAVCAAPTMGGWYRAQIMSVDEENSTSYVRFLDYGGYLVVESSSLRQIRGDLLTLPFQAVECYLANVAPADTDIWTEEARLFVQSLTQGQILQAQIYDFDEDGTPLVYLYASLNNQVILINEALVTGGFANLVEASSDKQESSQSD